VERFTKDPIGLGLTILKEQADAGAPVRVDEVIRMFLPPPLLQAVTAGSEFAAQAKDRLSDRVQRILGKVAGDGWG
jgi:hypothetical protein